MKDLNIQTIIKVCQYDELSDQDKQLIDKAKEMTQHSYAPYSKFKVGAMLSHFFGFINQLSPEVIRRMRLTRRAYAQNERHCSTPTRNIPTKRC